MHNPPRRRKLLQDAVLAEGGLSVSEFVKRLGVSRVALSRVAGSK